MGEVGGGWGLENGEKGHSGQKSSGSHSLKREHWSLFGTANIESRLLYREQHVIH